MHGSTRSSCYLARIIIITGFQPPLTTAFQASSCDSHLSLVVGDGCNISRLHLLAAALSAHRPVFSPENVRWAGGS